MNKEKVTFVVLGIQAIVLVVLAFQLYSLDKNMEKLGTLGSALTGGAVADLPSAPTAVLQLGPKWSSVLL